MALCKRLAQNNQPCNSPKHYLEEIYTFQELIVKKVNYFTATWPRFTSMPIAYFY